jgi:hypothetical protein
VQQSLHFLGLLSSIHRAQQVCNSTALTVCCTCMLCCHMLWCYHLLCCAIQAIDEQYFADMYADLCVKLHNQSSGWAFVKVCTAYIQHTIHCMLHYYSIKHALTRAQQMGSMHLPQLQSVCIRLCKFSRSYSVLYSSQVGLYSCCACHKLCGVTAVACVHVSDLLYAAVMQRRYQMRLDFSTLMVSRNLIYSDPE